MVWSCMENGWKNNESSFSKQKTSIRKTKNPVYIKYKENMTFDNAYEKKKWRGDGLLDR